VSSAIGSSVALRRFCSRRFRSLTVRHRERVRQRRCSESIVSPTRPDAPHATAPSVSTARELLAFLRRVRFPSPTFQAFTFGLPSRVRALSPELFLGRLSYSNEVAQPCAAANCSARHAGCCSPSRRLRPSCPRHVSAASAPRSAVAELESLAVAGRRSCE